MKKNNKFDSDAEERKILLEAAKEASQKAIREAKALGLTITIMRNNELIEKYPNGEEKVIEKITPVKINIKGLKKGVVLCKK